MKKKPVMLMILDGWGIAPPSPTNAVTRARTPHLDFYFNRYPHSQLLCSGQHVSRLCRILAPLLLSLFCGKAVGCPTAFLRHFYSS